MIPHNAGKSGARDHSAHCFLGIDFSGNVRMWSAGCKTSNVWIAELNRQPNKLLLHTLRRVQELPGNEPPFSRLARLLAARQFVAAGIDAPFSIPRPYLPATGHRHLVAEIAGLEKNGRPFAESRPFLGHFLSSAVKKPLRATEEIWRRKGINVRSTLWAGARSGAAMTTACLTLLYESGCPLWPWRTSEPGLLVEAFPAAQMRWLRLPHQGYTGKHDAAVAARRHMIRGLRDRFRIDVGAYEPQLLNSPDALDAVVCGLAALAVAEADVAIPPEPTVAKTEGWIAVHKGQ